MRHYTCDECQGKARYRVTMGREALSAGDYCELCVRQRFPIWVAEYFQVTVNYLE